MDDTPKAFLEELRSSILKKRVGQIALAVVLAQAVWRLLSAFTWYLIMPVIGRFLQGQTESVLLPRSSQPIPWENVFGSILEFLFTVMVVFYSNRWINKKPDRAEANPVEEYSLVGESLNPRDDSGATGN